MAAQDSDSEEDFVTFGKPLEQYEEGEKPKKPIPLQEQTVKDEKGRFKRFHGAFTGGFSAGYFNTVGTKEGWAPSTFVSSRQEKSESKASRPEDFMDEEDLGEFGIAPNEIMTTDDFASKTKNKIREKARELAAVTAPIPGATILEDLIAPAKITVGVQLLRQMGWKEGQGVGPRTKRKTRKQETDSGKKFYGCALPPTGSEGSEDEDEYLPENVTFAPKDVIPVDFTMKDNVHGLGYRGLDPRQALLGSLDSRVSLFGDGSERMFSSLGDVRPGKGRKVGISGQAFGVGALEDDDDDIYGTDSMSKYDTVLKEESGDNLFGWTAPKEYRNKKGSTKELKYIGKVLEGFSITSQSSALKKVYPAPELPRDYKPVHYFRPVLSATNSAALQALLASSQCPPAEPKKDQLPSRHQLSSSQRREVLGEEALQGPAPSVLDLLSNKDRERIKDVTQTLEDQRLKAQKLAQEAMKNRFQAASADEAQNKRQDELLDRRLIPPNASEFRPFEGNPEKQKRYEIYTRKLHEGQKDALVTSLDSKMTEWEQHREQDEFMRSAMLYKPTNSSLSSRFTRGKQEDDSDKVEVPMDQEGDMDDKSAAVKMKMFGKLTRDQFEWHPDKLLCKRFNIPDPYPQSTLIGLPKVKRDKYSVFNFLTIPEPQPSTTCAAISERAPEISDNRQKKSSRWDVSSTEKKKDPLSTFLSQARSQSDVKEEKEEEKEKRAPPTVSAATSSQSQVDQDAEVEEEETRPPIDLFKAIFADSSEKSSSEEESEEEDSPLPREEIEDSRPETSLPSIVREPKPEVHQPIPPTVTDGPDKMNAEEEFGPRLPPALPSATPRITCESPSLSRDDSLKKSKQKRHKEKHRLKKEHKHKKEKKKKHKKQKHKSKHKNKKENNDSTDSEDSSADLSDTEEAAKITPRELLKRLKNLPIPH